MQIPNSKTLEKIASDRAYAEQLCDKMAENAKLPIEKTREMLKMLDIRDLYSIYQMFCLNNDAFQSYLAVYYKDRYGEPIGSLFDGMYGEE